ncbi:MAG TPA: hypothetical protein VGW57_12470 [Chthoniobacterales bacterium]|nr:hypothetical protein [Chthoniobacterales bacterium]
MCNFVSLFRILVAVFVILPFADAIAQTSPAPAQASTSSWTDPSPDKKWEYVGGDDQSKLLKADTKEVVLDLWEKGPSSVLWAPDSKRFALTSGAEKHECSLYQLRDNHWVELESPDDEAYKRADAVLAAEAKRKGVPKKASVRTLTWSIAADKWVQATSLMMRVSLSKYFQWGEDHSDGVSGDFQLTLKFDGAGKWKIVKMRPMSEKEAEDKH